MRTRIATLVIALLPLSLAGAGGQATTVDEPTPGYTAPMLGILGTDRVLGDLRAIALPDSALELRYRGIGWTGRGLRRQRSENGRWRAHRIVVNPPNAASIDSVSPDVALESAVLDSLWNDLVREGLLTLPTHVRPPWHMLDGYMHVFELRRGQYYRVSAIEHWPTPEFPADSVVRRLRSILDARFAFLRTRG